ncbi:molybdopterin-dependent oxidoreductase [Nocardiopsis sp. L17-MgMaSL7]|uniref:molybdopterin-dependent oxidoreductase n=1 Tax=Nocardiopsis sp. L17-MgMaSL7 TaxID=1938893 RepID=UPI000D71AA93|nr:molybdopterin-dependent oxidoreductase [Nocardiopsis sp. L17-MgMaSL7]PWV44699.1 DMSO/TMAO reductase YedYZ molybdopterin-dependent catalytic subunit [Nocardiopsis sp. L17-MgMaSL7]
MPHVTTGTRGEQHPPRDGRRWGVGAGLGLLVVGAALGFGELAAGLLRVTSPVVTVGDALVDNSPQFLMSWAIALFGTADKAVLVIGVLIVLILSGAALGVVASRRPVAGYVGLGLFTAVGLAAVALRRADDLGAATAVVVGGVAGTVALALLLRSLGPAPSRAQGSGPDAEPKHETDTDRAAEAGSEKDTEPNRGPRARGDAPGVPQAGPDAGPGRRGFVLTAAGVLAASGTAGALGRTLPSLLGGAGTGIQLALPAPASPLPALPSGVDLGVPGLAPFTTPNTDFYRIDTALTVPRPDPARWTLRVHGMVDRPFEIDMNELLSRDLVEADITLACVSNQVGGDLVGNTRWLGFPLADLLREAGVRSGADQILSTSSDGWTCGTPTEVVMDGRDALLAVGMGGEPLPHEHGYPARMVVPGLYGFVSATKWVTDIKLTRFADEQAYWAQRGWGVRAPIKTMSRIDVPSPLGRVESGEVVLAGVAWAQHTGVAGVEVRVDDGDWWEAELAEVPGIDTWVQWVAETTVGPGNHAVEVRATDATGFTQPSERVDPIPDGATGWHRIRFTAT